MLFAMFKLETLLPEAPLEKVKIQLFKIFEFVPMIFTGMLNVKFFFENSPSMLRVSPLFTREVVSPLVLK